MTKPISRRRKERAQVYTRLKGVFLQCEELSPQELRVVNVSELGIGIEIDLISQVLVPGQKMDARLIVGLTVAPIQIRFVHYTPEKTPQVAGFEFIDLSPILQDAVRTYFEPELVGASLRKVDSTDQFLKYEDKNSNCIEIRVSKSNEIERLVFIVLGNRVEWNHSTKEMTHIQNENVGPVSDFFRKQLLQLVGSSRVLEPEHETKIKNILRFLD